jgi:hypothetical protein
MRIPLLLALLAQLISPAPKPGHATIVSSPRDVAGKAGTKLALFVDVTPKPGIHVYAPGANDYIPISVKLNAQPAIKAGKLAYPRSEIVSIADEKVPVFQQPFRLTQDVTVGETRIHGRRRRHGELSGVRRQGVLSAGIGAGVVDDCGEIGRG